MHEVFLPKSRAGCVTQVTHAVLKSGEKVEADMVLVGVGARPNTELFKGQLELLEERPGGIKVRARAGLTHRLPPGVWVFGEPSRHPPRHVGWRCAAVHGLLLIRTCAVWPAANTSSVCSASVLMIACSHDTCGWCQCWPCCNTQLPPYSHVKRHPSQCCPISWLKLCKRVGRKGGLVENR